MERALAHSTDALVAVSDEVRDDLVSYGVAPAGKFTVIPYGFDLDARVGSAATREATRASAGLGESFVVGWAGRLTAIKRPLDLVHAIAEVEGATLVAAGDGELRPQVEALAAKLGVDDRVRLLGYVTDMASWYSAFDTFLLTSANEGTPVVAIEALAAGVPVVATAAGGTRGRGRRRGDRAPRARRRRLRARVASATPARRAGRAGGARRRGSPPDARPVLDRAHGRRCRAPLPQTPGAMKVLHLTKVSGVGGAEQHLLSLLPALRERGVDAEFLSLDAGSDSSRFHRALDERGIPWSRVACGLDLSPRLATAVTRRMRDLKPDLVHTHMVHADAYGSLAAHLLRLPFVSTRHNDDRYLLGPFRYVDRGLMHGVRRIVAISEAVRLFHIEAGLPAAKLETIHYGLDETPAVPSEVTPEQLGVPAGAPLVLAIGRLIAQKDHATLLEAFGRVREAHAGGQAGDPRLGTARGADARSTYADSGSPTRCCSPAGSSRANGSNAPTSSRTRRAGRDSASCCSRRCCRRCPSLRRA